MAPLREVRVRRHPSGQWQYQIEIDGRVTAAWQFGPWDKEGAVNQAMERYGRDFEIVEEDGKES